MRLVAVDPATGEAQDITGRYLLLIEEKDIELMAAGILLDLETTTVAANIVVGVP